MKKLLALILLSPIAYSEVHTFACKLDDSNDVASLKIDTDKKYIEFDGVKIFDRVFIETNTIIEAVNINDYANGFVLNKITGRAKQTFPNGFTVAYDYTCKLVSPLIP